MRVSPVNEGCHPEPLMETRPQLGNLSETMGPWEGEAVAHVGVGGRSAGAPHGEVGQGPLTPQKGLWVPLSIPKLAGRPWLFWVSHASRMQQLCRTMQPGRAQAGGTSAPCRICRQGHVPDSEADRWAPFSGREYKPLPGDWLVLLVTGSPSC